MSAVRNRIKTSHTSPRFREFIAHFSPVEFEKNRFGAGHQLIIGQRREFKVLCATQNFKGHLEFDRLQQCVKGCEMLLGGCRPHYCLRTSQLNARTPFISSPALNLNSSLASTPSSTRPPRSKPVRVLCD